MKRFTPWILLFFLFLIFIPLLIKQGNFAAAKLLGVLTVVGVAIALNVWRVQTKKQNTKSNRIKLNLNDRFWLNEHVPFYRNLSKSDRLIFEDRIGLFLTDVIVTEVEKKEVSKEACLYVASSAIIAFWGLPYWNYGELSEVLLYPDNYNDAFEVSAKGNIQGQVHEGGLLNTTMILSMRALVHGFSNSTDKKNVGVHEFAHLIDKADGIIDGIPADMDKEMAASWLDLFRGEMEKINKGKSDINPYGATNVSEFFAVILEYYKERPTLLEKKHPAIFKIVNDYFTKNAD